MNLQARSDKVPPRDLQSRLEQARFDREAITANIQKLEQEIKDAKPKDRPQLEICECPGDGKRLIIRYDVFDAFFLRNGVYKDGGMLMFNIASGQKVSDSKDKNYASDFYYNYKSLKDVLKDVS